MVWDEETFYKYSFIVSVAEMIEKCVQLYINAFLLYLINKFAIEKTKSERKDVILGRNVPGIVFLQNKQLLKETMKNSMENDKYKK